MHYIKLSRPVKIWIPPLRTVHCTAIGILVGEVDGIRRIYRVFVYGGVFAKIALFGIASSVVGPFFSDLRPAPRPALRQRRSM
jgi:hypothetical protein